MTGMLYIGSITRRYRRAASSATYRHDITRHCCDVGVNSQFGDYWPLLARGLITHVGEQWHGMLVYNIHCRQNARRFASVICFIGDDDIMMLSLYQRQ